MGSWLGAWAWPGRGAALGARGWALSWEPARLLRPQPCRGGSGAARVLLWPRAIRGARGGQRDPAAPEPAQAAWLEGQREREREGVGSQCQELLQGCPYDGRELLRYFRYP